MEKRTFLAVILSLLLLFGYNSLVMQYQAKHPRKISLNKTQLIDSKDVTDYRNNEATPPVAQQPGVDISVPSALEETQTIDRDKITIETSNIGGKIKSISIKDLAHPFYIKNILDISGYENFPFSMIENSRDRIIYSFQNNDFSIKKIYTFKDDYGITTEVIFENISGMSKLKAFEFSGFTVDTTLLEKNRIATRDKSLFEYSISAGENISRKGNAFTFSPKEHAKKPGLINWVGFRDRYFCFVVKPEFKTSFYTTAPLNDKVIKISMGSDGAEIKPGESISYKFIAYIGPQDSDLLRRYQEKFEEIISFSNFSIIDFISKTTVRAMKFLNGIIHNLGICIILVSIGFYMAMYPLTLKGMKSMRKMQTLQPEIAKIREKYKSQPEKLNKEIMVLYKANKVNPVGGCFPLILQMPVFIGLYQALWRSTYLKGGKFLWIQDLSEPDRLIIFKQVFPVIGNEFNVLPIVMMVVMFLQQKLSSANITVTDPAQITQQRMMTTFLPIFMGFIFYGFSSGITLYFTVFYTLSTISQLKMSKVT